MYLFHWFFIFANKLLSCLQLHTFSKINLHENRLNQELFFIYFKVKFTCGGWCDWFRDWRRWLFSFLHFFRRRCTGIAAGTTSRWRGWDFFFHLIVHGNIRGTMFIKTIFPRWRRSIGSRTVWSFARIIHNQILITLLAITLLKTISHFILNNSRLIIHAYKLINL